MRNALTNTQWSLGTSLCTLIDPFTFLVLNFSMCSHELLLLLSKSKVFPSKDLFDFIMNISNNIRVWCASGGIYLWWSKVVCFVLFVNWDLPSHNVSCDAHYIFETLFDVAISQATTLHVVLIVVSSKHFWWWLWVHQLGLRLFGVIVWMLLIIEPFFSTKTKVRFNKFYFTIFKAKVWNVFNFWVDFVVGNSNKLQKLGCEKEKKAVETSMCSHLDQWHKLH
jgi:hypothetical protein